MLPPNPATFPLPMHHAGCMEWYDRLEDAVRALAPVYKQGTCHKRLMETLGRAARKAHRCGTAARFPKIRMVVRHVHHQMFDSYRNMPTFQYPSAELLAVLASKPVLEVGSGSGVMGLLVAAAGGDIVTTDPRPWAMGRSYDHRDLPEDRSFAERQRAARTHASCWRFDGLRHPYKAALDGQIAKISMDKSGPSRMSFQKLRRYPRNFRSLPSFHSVKVMDARQAVAAYPCRDILLLSPDPMHDGWVQEMLASLPVGARVFYADDWGEWDTKACRGFRIIATYPAKFDTVRDVLLMERIDDEGVG